MRTKRIVKFLKLLIISCFIFFFSTNRLICLQYYGTIKLNCTEVYRYSMYSMYAELDLKKEYIGIIHHTILSRNIFVSQVLILQLFI